MKKEITIAIVATILVLQFIGNTVGGVVGGIAEKIAEQLTNQIRVEQMLNGGGYHGILGEE
jgi:predicted lysophospholipase L1 biosynthesis ABC-type transport system permease subunit